MLVWARHAAGRPNRERGTRGDGAGLSRDQGASDLVFRVRSPRGTAPARRLHFKVVPSIRRKQPGKRWRWEVAAENGRKVVARNRKARHEYEIIEEYEAGLALKGAEVKSLREGNASFTDSFGLVEGGEVWLYNLHIAPYGQASIDAPDPKRPRKLLLHKREIERLASKTAERGLTLVPLDIHFTRGYAKVKLALARGKKLYDKREDLKRRAMRREVDRAIRDVQGRG